MSQALEEAAENQQKTSEAQLDQYEKSLSQMDSSFWQEINSYTENDSRSRNLLRSLKNMISRPPKVAESEIEDEEIAYALIAAGSDYNPTSQYDDIVAKGEEYGEWVEEVFKDSDISPESAVLEDGRPVEVYAEHTLQGLKIEADVYVAVDIGDTEKDTGERYQGEHEEEVHDWVRYDAPLFTASYTISPHNLDSFLEDHNISVVQQSEDAVNTRKMQKETTKTQAKENSKGKNSDLDDLLTALTPLDNQQGRSPQTRLEKEFGSRIESKKFRDSRKSSEDVRPKESENIVFDEFKRDGEPYLEEINELIEDAITAVEGFSGVGEWEDVADQAKPIIEKVISPTEKGYEQKERRNEHNIFSEFENAQLNDAIIKGHNAGTRPLNVRINRSALLGHNTLSNPLDVGMYRSVVSGHNALDGTPSPEKSASKVRNESDRTFTSHRGHNVTIRESVLLSYSTDHVDNLDAKDSIIVQHHGLDDTTGKLDNTIVVERDSIEYYDEADIGDEPFISVQKDELQNSSIEDYFLSRLHDEHLLERRDTLPMEELPGIPSKDR